MSEPKTTGPIEDLEQFQEQLAGRLAECLPVAGFARIVCAVESVTEGWSVRRQTMRPVTDPHHRYEIYTPWLAPDSENLP